MPFWGFLAVREARRAQRLLREGNPQGAMQAVGKTLNRVAEAGVLLIMVLTILLTALPNPRFMRSPPRDYIYAGMGGVLTIMSAQNECGEGVISSLIVQAWPLTQEHGPRPSFFADESGVIRGALLDGQPGDMEMPVYPR